VTRFAETYTAVADNARVRRIHEDEAKRVERQFAPAKAKAAANASAFAAKRTFALA
jgi:hypothetical protein